MKTFQSRLAIITTFGSLVVLFYGCASSPDGASKGSSSETTSRSPSSLASQASAEEQMRQVLRRYKVGVTTHKKFMSDATAGSWRVGLGGMGMEVMSGDTTVSMTVGLGDREVGDLVFEGKGSLTTGKAPDVERFLLKQITFKP